jgi:hypothetical protein
MFGSLVCQKPARVTRALNASRSLYSIRVAIVCFAWCVAKFLANLPAVLKLKSKDHQLFALAMRVRQEI